MRLRNNWMPLVAMLPCVHAAALCIIDLRHVIKDAL
jgi:hypothetical protein